MNQFVYRVKLVFMGLPPTHSVIKGLSVNNFWVSYLGMSFRFVVIFTLLLGASHDARAEYGDIVINNYADVAGMSPVIFPHWFHRTRFTCKVCHTDLGFKFKAGGNEINMAKIMDGQFCGACHNGEIAWSVENCTMCHSAKPGTPTQVHDSQVPIPRAIRK